MRWLTVICLLGAGIVVACGGDGDDAGSPVVLEEIPVECSGDEEHSVFPDDIAIANEILAETSDQLLFDADERNALAAEVGLVLAVVRAEFPPAHDVRARPYSPVQLGFALEGPLMERVLKDAGELVGHDYWLRIGDQAIDDLSEELGVRFLSVGVRNSREPEAQTVTVRACLSDRVNPGPAAVAYAALEGVRYADPNRFSGDTPMIDMRKDDGTWHVVVREAGGDCLSGCTTEDLSFFKVTDGVIEEVPEDAAADEWLFREVVQLTWSGSDREWPSSSPTQ